MATIAAPNTTAPRQSIRWGPVVRTLSIMIIAFFAFVQITPFIITLTNSFKCLPAITANEGAFVPVAPFFIECRDATGRVRSGEEMTSGVTFNPSLEGYQEIITRGNLPRWLFNTTFYAIAVTVLRLIFDSMAGYALARLKFPGNRLMFTIILGTLMIPGVVLLIPRFILLKQMGLLDTYHGYVIVLAADAFGIFLMKQFFESIPGEIEEAAQVDGADRFTIFFRIVLPMATPALTALTIFSFQGQWNNFMDALVIVGRNTDLFNLPMGLTILRGNGETVQFHQALAGSVITTVPMAIIFFIFQRYFVEGVSYSGLKG
jgi:multiple sugar transport system permease protein